MWRPDDVITENKKRATAVWVALLLTVVGFVVWQTMAVVSKYRNPSTSFTVSDDVYRFPYTEVCLGAGSGCSWDEAECVGTVNATVFDPCDYVLDVQIESAPTSPQCVTFDMGRVDTEAFDPECLGGSKRAFVVIQMHWISDNTTSMEYSSSVSVFLGGQDVHQETWVPYTRFVSEEEQIASDFWVAQTDLTIGKNVRSFLSGDDFVTYPVLASSTSYLITRDQTDWYNYIATDVLGTRSSSSSSTGENPALGDLLLTLTQGSHSLTGLEDENPLDIFDYLGNIGGFWEILLLLWGIFFISRHTDGTPRQKARNFTKAIQTVVSKSNRVSAVSGPSRSTSVTWREEFDIEEYPDVSRAYAGPRQASTRSIPATISTAESTV